MWFRYDKSLPYVLQGASFKISAGEHVALCGASGSGKSTILKILLRVLEPERGEVLVDGRPLQGLNLDIYRKCLGVVMQDDQLFTGSIMENIAMFEDPVDAEKLSRCCDMACLSDDLAAMPMGLMTMVGDMGSALSGGQKQRVILAWAFYREPLILLTDEATSHLDADMELKLTKSLAQLKVTRLTIAHRQETLRSADRILRLENKIVSPTVTASSTS